MPESPPWSSSLGWLALGVAMLYHVWVREEQYDYPGNLSAALPESVTLSPGQIAVLVLFGVGALGCAGWLGFTDETRVSFVATVFGTLVSLAYLLALHGFAPAGAAYYPLRHSYRAAIVALALFCIALVSFLLKGSWRNPEGSIRRVLVGSDPTRIATWGVTSGVLSLILAGSVAFGDVPIWVISPLEAFEFVGDRPVLCTLVLLAWFGLAAVPGYRAEGLVSSWALVFGPLVAGVGTHATDPSVTWGFEYHRPVLGMVWVLTTNAIVIALIVGTLGYLLGGVVRYVTGSARSRQRETSSSERVRGLSPHTPNASSRPDNRTCPRHRVNS